MRRYKQNPSTSTKVAILAGATAVVGVSLYLIFKSKKADAAATQGSTSDNPSGSYPSTTQALMAAQAELWTDPLAAQVAALARKHVGANDTIRKFQAREGLTPDGLYGVHTALALWKFGHPVPAPYIGSKSVVVPTRTSSGESTTYVPPSFPPVELPLPPPNTQAAGSGVAPSGIPYGTSVSTSSVWDPSTWTAKQFSAVEAALMIPAVVVTGTLSTPAGILAAALAQGSMLAAQY